MSRGKVYLIGAGPGDPGLLTLKGKEILSKADVVVYDALVHPKILEFIPKGARKIFRGSRGKSGAMKQSQINDLLVQLASQGKRVVRLKGGDPFVFGRGAEEIMALAGKKIDFEVVPGVTSAVAVPAYAGIPVTHRGMNSSFTVVTGHEDPSKDDSQVDWAHLARDRGTLVFLMGLHRLPILCRRLIEEGKSPDTPAAVIQSGTTVRQKTVTGTLESLPALSKKAGLQPPATVVVGEVVGLAPKLNWLSQKPLWGCRVLVTRNQAKAGYLSNLLSEEGAEVVQIATFELKSLRLDRHMMEVIRKSREYDWIVFSSVNAVELFFGHLLKEGICVKDLKAVKIACIGEATAKAVKSFGHKVALVPDDYKQEGLANAFQRIPLKGKRILFARAREGRDLLVQLFKKRKVHCDLLALYENKIPKGTRQELQELFSKGGGVDLLTFASSSSVDHFYGFFNLAQRKKWLVRIPAAVIGPVTAASVKKWGGKVVVQPAKYTMPDLVAAIVKWADKQSNS
jgi:uroporphyrinogen III methyltransferase / synthase